MKVRSFEDLETWQIAVELAKVVYQLLETLPEEEKFGIVAQTKDSVVSISGNIAEGFGRFHYKDKIKFYYNSRGSLLETKSHLLVSNKLGFINSKNKNLYEKALQMIEKLGVKLNNYIKSVGKQ